jgi:hypothetical protein
VALDRLVELWRTNVLTPWLNLMHRWKVLSIGAAPEPLTSGSVAPEIPVLLLLDNNTMRLRLTMVNGARTERTKLATARKAASTAIVKSEHL